MKREGLRESLRESLSYTETRTAGGEIPAVLSIQISGNL
jgi:hypothetical protein